jgi:hypothetical protein
VYTTSSGSVPGPPGEPRLEIDEEEYDNSHKNKMRKGPSNYKKYVDSKYMEYNFKIEELEELSKSTVSNDDLLLIPF